MLRFTEKVLGKRNACQKTFVIDIWTSKICPWRRERIIPVAFLFSKCLKDAAPLEDAKYIAHRRSGTVLCWQWWPWVSYPTTHRTGKRSKWDIRRTITNWELPYLQHFITTTCAEQDKKQECKTIFFHCQINSCQIWHGADFLLCSDPYNKALRCTYCTNNVEWHCLQDLFIL